MIMIATSSTETEFDGGNPTLFVDTIEKVSFYN